MPFIICWIVARWFAPPLLHQHFKKNDDLCLRMANKSLNLESHNSGSCMSANSERRIEIENSIFIPSRAEWRNCQSKSQHTFTTRSCLGFHGSEENSRRKKKNTFHLSPFSVWKWKKESEATKARCHCCCCSPSNSRIVRIYWITAVTNNGFKVEDMRRINTEIQFEILRFFFCLWAFDDGWQFFSHTTWKSDSKEVWLFCEFNVFDLSPQKTWWKATSFVSVECVRPKKMGRYQLSRARCWIENFSTYCMILLALKNKSNFIAEKLVNKVSPPSSSCFNLFPSVAVSLAEHSGSEERERASQTSL